jgi:hypothetical protein
VRRAAAHALGQIGDERAVKPILALATTDAECAETAIGVLQRILEHSASRLASEDLRAVAQLPQVDGWHYGVYECVDAKWKQQVDCSYVKQLARQELIGRGFPGTPP